MFMMSQPSNPFAAKKKHRNLLTYKGGTTITRRPSSSNGSAAGISSDAYGWISTVFWLIFIGLGLLVITMRTVHRWSLSRRQASALSHATTIGSTLTTLVADPRKFYGYESQEELDLRLQRFPSVEERVKIYMSNWYVPPCDGDQDATVIFDFRPNHKPEEPPLLVAQEVAVKGQPRRIFSLEGTIHYAQLVYLNREELWSCDQEYCVDVRKYVVPALERVAGDRAPAIPTIVQFGDHEVSKAYVPATRLDEEFPFLPQIKKFRNGFTRDQINAMTVSHCFSKERSLPEGAHMEPIVWKLKVLRHFGMLDDIPANDRPWSQKRNAAVYRGGLTGVHKEGLTNRAWERLSSEDQCAWMPRCRLVYNHFGSPLVNASLVGPTKGLPRRLDDVELFGSKMDFAEMLEYKAIIMLEGNDVASGLKWALFSNSVVMTTQPLLTSWAMEELLEPWVHFIPLDESLEDVEEKMQWIIDNDEEAQRIAHQGSLWIRDLVYHPRAAAEDQAIFDEMTRRYRAHWKQNPDLPDP